MTVLKSNLSRWMLAPLTSTGHGVIHVLLFLLLQNLPSGVGQANGLADPKPSSGSVFSVPFTILIMVLLIAFLIMGFLSVFFQYCGVETLPTTTDAATRGGGVVGGRRPTRAARGLDAEVIESFPTFLYSEVKGLKIGKGALECAVCLNEFEDDETLRLMPQCSHVFHPECIDVWLSCHSTCPVCRANLVLEPGESFPYTAVQIHNPTTNPVPEPETNNAERRVLESPDASLLNSVRWTNGNRPPRSRSTGLSSWRIKGIIPRSHSTGHSMVQPGDNLDRFTLRLPEEVRSQLMKTSALNRTKSQAVSTQARSSRRGYRSGSVGSQRNVFPHEWLGHRRASSLASPFFKRIGSLRSTNGGSRDEMHDALPKGVSEKIKSPSDHLFQGKDDSRERSSDRLRCDG